ncbi:NAD(P)H-dependent oxidoreductase [Nonomuraea sp. MG754425]|uniref:NADPH-dependent FMN reductase n=1 Tax=Nonomuraea sp. MG754425 TaxID=2570319 RepID=UPI001F3BB0F4|nr:NAD(P)H-dependent oxidoreductase [Nonomuraea sp. MG754425]MCF6471268.1 NAD(P)H-dependent oxidoreductase [Nonomuraea sp. MG754425]
MSAVPEVVLLSGSLTSGSKSDRVATWCAARCVGEGVRARVFRGVELQFPFYRPAADVPPSVREYLDVMERADGVVLVSPSYHGAVTGLLKNALDYVNELADPDRPLLDGRPIGCVALAQGEQGATTTLAMLRTIGHALRGWPTPLGVTLSGDRALIDETGSPAEEPARARLQVMLSQVISLSRTHARRRAALQRA